jgi:hypothetical protein
MAGIQDAVRTAQLPNTSVGQPYTSPGSLVSNKPITLTPGFGASAPSNLPPIQTGSGHYDLTITYYMDQAAVEKTATAQEV